MIYIFDFIQIEFLVIDSSIHVAEWQGGNYEATKGILNYIYNGSVEVYKRDLETFVDASQFLDISTNLQDLNLTDIMSGMNDIIPAEIIWNNWGEDFVSGFQSLYAEKKHFDVTLQINGRELKAHRHVLSACSKYFEPIFSCVGIENPITGKTFSLNFSIHIYEFHISLFRNISGLILNCNNSLVFISIQSQSV